MRNKNILKLCLSLILFLTVNSASAAMYLIEPSVGLRTETIKLTDFSMNETQLKSSTPVFGLKLGLRSQLGVELALAYDYTSGKSEVTGSPEKSPFNHQTGSLNLGVNALGMMKIYLGYAFFNDLKLDSTTTITAFTLSGPAYIAGLQFKLFPMTYLGLQYNLNQFKKIKGDSFVGSDTLDDYFTKTDAQDYSVYLNLSF